MILNVLSVCDILNGEEGQLATGVYLMCAHLHICKMGIVRLTECLSGVLRPEAKT